MAVVRLPADRIADWASFHSVCKEAFGFPDFYGENMNAFADCLSYIDEGDGMSPITLQADEDLRIEIVGSVDFSVRNPEILVALKDAVQLVNERFLERRMRERVVIEYV